MAGIADFRLLPLGGLMNIGRSCRTTFSIVNLQLKPLFSITFPPSQRISFVFIYIPATPPSFPQPSFVFNNIPVLFDQKKEFFLTKAHFLSS
jgi:hypothetical protein